MEPRLSDEEVICIAAGYLDTCLVISASMLLGVAAFCW